LKKFVAVVAALVLAVTSVQQATADNFSSSSYDSYTYNGTPANFDIDYIQYAEFTDSPDFHYFAVFTKGVITPKQFNDGLNSWAMVDIDSDLDGVAEYRIETTNVDLVGNYGSPAVISAINGDTFTEVPGCSPQFYGDMTAAAQYVTFTVPWDCMKLPTTFAFSAYMEYMDDLGLYFDYVPDFTFFQASHSFSNQPQVSVSKNAPTATSDGNGPVSGPSQAPAALERLSPEVLKSVVTIFCSGAVGSGWSAKVALSTAHKNSGYKSFIVTNHHVVENCINSGLVTLELSDGSSHRGYVISWDEKNDLAGIVTSASVLGLTWRGQTPSQGWWVGVLGAPRGLSGYLTTGLISIVVPQIGELGTTSPVNPGNSGGPVFDREGRVLATVSWKLLESEGLAFAKTSPLLCVSIIVCPSSLPVWSSNPSGSASDLGAKDELTGEVIEGGMLVQRAGSQVFVTSADLQGNFELYEDGQLVSTFTFNGISQAHIVEQRITGAIQIRKIEGGSASLVSYEMTKTLLWFQNINLGAFSMTSLGTGARDKVSNLVNHKYLEDGVWTQRDSDVTKFICTGIYREGATSAEKLAARKKAKLACDAAGKLDTDPNSQVSFFYQTKPTKAASYVGKVLVTVKGIEQTIGSRLNG
jgi:S1-C subfamily serine protease